jgi:hypothetical protein
MDDPGDRRPLAAGAAGVLCLTVLIWMLVSHAWPIWTGETIYLRTRPVDPRDLFRGDYVVLAYDIDRVILADPAPPVTETAPEEQAVGSAGASLPSPQPPPTVVRPIGDWWRPAEEETGDAEYFRSRRLRDKRLYLQLERQPSDDTAVPFLLRPVSVADEPQAGFVNLQGRCRSVSSWGSRGGPPLLNLHFGIDALFVPERSGLPVEEAIRARKPVYAVVAVAASGKARITDLLVDGRPFLAGR